MVGWALVYLPHVPEDFHRATAGPADSDPVEALNISLVTLTTLGFGDVTPDAAWLRLVVPVEALLGFGLPSASISWLLLIHPALARRRSLAYEIALLQESRAGDRHRLLARCSAGRADLRRFPSSRLVAVERDLGELPRHLLLRRAGRALFLGIAMPYLIDLAEHGR